MPRARALPTYPNAHYSTLFRTVAHGSPITIPMTRTQGLSMRGDINAWRRVAMANQAQARGLGIPVDALPPIRIRVGDDGLTLYHTADSPGTDLIEAALGAKGIVVQEGQPIPEPTVAGEVVETTGLSEEEIAKILRGEAS